MPAEDTEALENLAFDLAQEASVLSGQLHPIVRLSMADRVRSMNCYYSNLIEGHNTHPRDIDRGRDFEILLAVRHSTSDC